MSALIYLPKIKGESKLRKLRGSSQSFDQLWFSVESTPILSHKSFFDGFILQNWAKFTSLSWSICMHDWHLFFYSFSNCSRFVDVESTASYQLIFKGWYWQLIFNASRSCVEITLLIQLLTFNYFSTGVSFSTDSQQLPTWVEKLLNHGCWIYVKCIIVYNYITTTLKFYDVMSCHLFHISTTYHTTTTKIFNAVSYWLLVGTAL